MAHSTNAPTPRLPHAFSEQMRQLLGAEYEAFEAALTEPAPVSIRLNPFKTVDAGRWMVDGRLTANAAEPSAVHRPPSTVAWHPLGFYLAERPVFTLDPAFHAGAYYVQEASSMFLHEALRQSVDFSKALKVLDLCAAPGGKSTLLASLLNAESLLVANEVIRTRAAPLRENLERWGCPNVAVTSAEADEFAEKLPDWFDVVVADAPCSGEGMFRKDPDAVGEWSPAHVQLCAGRQRRILAAAVATLAPGGILAYSTCTYNHAENAENAAWLAEEFGMKPLKTNTLPEWGIVGTDGGGLQFFPHRVRGEGFFIAVFRKPDEGEVARLPQPSAFKSLTPLAKNLLPEMSRWLAAPGDSSFFQTPTGEVLALPAGLLPEYLTLDKALKIKWFGTAVGEFKGKDFAPAHALALSQIAAPSLPALDLDRDTALRFLRKETFEPPTDAPRGWAVVRFEGLNLGWVKILPNRLNNYLPAERRIRMRGEE